MNKEIPEMPPEEATTEVKAEKKSRGFNKRGRRVLIYGEGGVGKTTLATKIKGKTLFIDLEASLLDLFDEDTLPENITPYWPKTWEEVKKALGSKNAKEYDNIIVDSLTSLETLFWRYIAAHYRKAKAGFGEITFSEAPLPPLKEGKELGGGGADSAKYTLWTEFEGFISELTAEGINFVNLCHDCEKTTDDAADGATAQHQPRLLDPKSGKNSIRLRAYETHGEVWAVRWEKLRIDDIRTKPTGRRIVYGQPDEEHAAEFVGLMTKSRRGFSTAYLDEFDINAVLGI